MNYRIKIVRTEPNPDFVAELEKYEEHQRYRYVDERASYPEKEIAKDILITEITEEQFLAIRKAVFDKF